MHTTPTTPTHTTPVTVHTIPSHRYMVEYLTAKRAGSAPRTPRTPLDTIMARFYAGK